MKETELDEKLDVAEQLLASVRNGIDAARYYARHEAISGMTGDDPKLVELASAVEEAAADLDAAMLSLLDHTAVEIGDETEQVN